MKIFRIYSREHGTTLAFSPTLEDAQKVKNQLEREFFSDYLKKCGELKDKMKPSFENMAKSNNLSLTCELSPKFPSLEQFIDGMLNDKKYNDEFEECTCKTQHPQIVCDCTYKTRDSIEIQEIPLVTNLDELRKEEK